MSTSKFRFGAVYELAIYTGRRRGELSALRWEDIDVENRTLTVKKNRVDADGKIPRVHHEIIRVA